MIFAFLIWIVKKQKMNFRIFIIATLSILCNSLWCDAQTVVVQTNNGVTNANNTDPNIRYINGIPSTQDIGGVETSVSRQGIITFKNYHSFTVTVNYEINYQKGPDHDDYQKIGSLVIPTGEYKTVSVPVYSHRIHEIYTITRRL